jgi:hypothetical protein
MAQVHTEPGGNPEFGGELPVAIWRHVGPRGQGGPGFG